MNRATHQSHLERGLRALEMLPPAVYDPGWAHGAPLTAAGDRDTLRPLLSPDVFAAFDAGIAGRSEPPAALVKLADARIVRSGLHGREAEITVAFTAEFATGTVIDVWSFERNLDSKDPNWVLVATSSDVPE